MKGQSRPRSRDRSPVPPTPKWKSFRSSDGSDKSKDGGCKGKNEDENTGKGRKGKGGCKDKNEDENTGKGRKGKTKTKTTAAGLKLFLCASGWKPAPECENTRHDIRCQGWHPSCKMLYYGPRPKWHWQWKEEGSDSDNADERTKCPSGLDPTLTCPSTPDSEPE